MPPLVDPFGRVHRDLRISVTDRCNFRCTYCMPEEGMEWLPRDEVLTFEEIERVARLCVERFGFDSIRLTGGEPTVRAHLPVLVEQLAAPRRRPGDDHQRRHPAAAAPTTCGRAGLRRVNISLRLAAARPLPRSSPGATRSTAVLDGIDAALEAGFDPVKVNVRAACGASTTTRSSTSPASGASGASRCASSSSCPSTPTTPGSRASVVPGRADRRRHRRRVPARRRGPGVRAGRDVGLRRRRGARSA